MCVCVQQAGINNYLAINEILKNKKQEQECYSYLPYCEILHICSILFVSLESFR